MGSLKDAPGVIGDAPRAYVTVKNVMCLLGCGEDWAYKTIRKVNRIAEEHGKMAFPPGKANKFSFSDQFDIPMGLIDEVIDRER